MENLETQIEQQVTEPASATSDGTTVVNRSLTELLDADDRIRARAAMAGRKSAWSKTRMAQVCPPGTV